MALYISFSILYVILGTITAGVVNEINGKDYNWDTINSFPVGIFFPITWLWYVVLKPLAILSARLARYLVDGAKARQRVRERQARELRLRIIEAEKEVEQVLQQDDIDAVSSASISN